MFQCEGISVMCVLVIMPLRVDEDVEAKRNVIIDIIGGEVNLPRMATDDTQPDFDLAEAIEKLRDVDLVIADLSFERPSCYFELGMAQAIGTPVFLIARNGTVLHQHSGSVRFYKDLEEFRQLIMTAASEHLRSSYRSTEHDRSLNRSCS